jgi:hypothetical protein
MNNADKDNKVTMRNRLVSSRRAQAPYTRRRTRATRQPRATLRHRRHLIDVTQITRQFAYQRGQFYWFPWAEPVGPVNDPAATAAKLARVLRAVPEPSYG